MAQQDSHDTYEDGYSAFSAPFDIEVAFSDKSTIKWCFKNLNDDVNDAPSKFWHKNTVTQVCIPHNLPPPVNAKGNESLIAYRSN